MTWQDKIRNPHCTDCSLHETAQHVCLMGSGTRKARLMIVGEAPGAREDDEHAAFVGPAGKLLTSLLEEAGLSRDEAYITNAVKCRPPDNATPDRSHVRACSHFLAAEVDKVRPDVVLGVGNTALLALTGRSGITKHRGKVWSESPSVLCTFHPAAALRSARYLPQIRSDFEAAARLLRGESTNLKTSTKLITTKAGTEALVKVLKRAPVIAFDLETSGLHEWAKDAFIVTLGVSWGPGKAAIVVLNHSSMKHSNQHLLKLLKPVLEDTSKKYIAHNGKFDCKWLSAFGVHVPLTFDTMIAAHLLDENRPKGLKPLSQMLLGADDYDIDVKDCYNHELRKLARYNGKDCDYTFRLYEIFRKELIERPRLLRLFTKLMMPASDIFTRLELGGTYVDGERLHARTKEAQQIVAKLERAMLKTSNQEKINFNSPAQVGVWLFKELGLDVVETTAKGAPSTKESVLLKLQEQHKAVRALLKYRKWSNFLSTYLLPWSERLDGRSRIHPSYRLTGTTTGRLSSSEPNLQQVPRDSFIRGILGSQPGWSFVEADFSQIELRLAALLSRDKTMMEILASGEDMHTNTAEAILKHMGKFTGNISKDERVIWGKHPNFGLLFGMYAKKYREYVEENSGIDIGLGAAEEVYGTFHATYPGLRRWHARQIRSAHSRGSVTSLLGRVRHLPDLHNSNDSVRMEAERQAINSVVQGLASDLCLYAGVRLSRSLPHTAARLVGSVHDALLFEVKEGHEKAAAKKIKLEMEDMRPVKRTFGATIDVPIVVDVEIGKHWSEGTPIDV